MSDRLGERIGKYRVLARVGRGGMGTVLKAHDPILDRVVALKVVSADVELTDEMRARFFREAQACARLSHQNVITVYDLADTDGQLFIVMEFLEGEELKQIIAQRRPLSLEDKLSFMVQVCDGLAYAHERGVVHRDIKPSNIFVLTTGRVKILDFGIARIMSSEANLTRTGLIMGTLRYMAPEQARGRADYRADIFSVGTVFYELLTYRPAFEADDPMEILEALRTHEPPLVSDVDPGIPAAVAHMIAAALRKDPSARLQDFAEMRRVFETTRRRLLGEAENLRETLRPQLERLRQLHSIIGERLGAPVQDDTAPMVAEGAGFSALKQLEHDAAARVAKLQDLLDRADAVEPAVLRALELQKEGKADAVIEALEPVVRDLPEHARANAVLVASREQVERDRRRHEALRQVLADARTALDRGAFAVCLEQLTLLQQGGLPSDLLPELDVLRRAAEAARAADARRREEVRRARESAERRRDELLVARRRARDAQAAQSASATWDAAETRAAEGHTTLQAEAFVRAIEHFEAAVELYRSAEAEAHEVARARLRAEAEAARARARDARDVAEGFDAAALATAAWQQASAHEERGAAAFRDGDFTAAIASLESARGLYESAGNDARDELKRRARERLEAARQEAARCRHEAEAVEASIHAKARWSGAEAKQTLAEQAVADESYAVAAQYYGEAVLGYQAAVSEAQTVVRARRQVASEEAQQRAQSARGSAEDARASVYAAESWSRAVTAEQEAIAASGHSDFTASTSLFDVAERAFRGAASAARSERDRQERDGAERARAAMEAARAAAHASGSPEHTHSAWNAGEARRRDGSSAFVHGAFADANEHFDAAASLYHEAESSARDVKAAIERAAAEAATHAREAAARRVEALVADARELLAGGDAEEALARADEALNVIPTHPAAAEIKARAEEESQRRRARRTAIDRLFADAQARLAHGDVDSAIGVLEQLLELDPVHVGAIQALDGARARLERTRLDRERLQREERERERLEWARVEQARLEQQRLERERIARSAEPTPLSADEPASARGTDGAVEPAADATAAMRAALDEDATALALPVPELAPHHPRERASERRDKLPRRNLIPAQKWFVAAASVAIIGGAVVYFGSALMSRPVERRDSAPTREVPDGDAKRQEDIRLVEAQKRAVLSARQAAETAGATGSAPAGFASATQLEQQGDDAVAATRFDEARRLYGRAISAYEAAAAAAREKSAAAGREAATRQLQMQAGAAKRAAEVTGARDGARAPWEKGENAEQQAIASLRDANHDAAQRSFREAEQRYREAERTAAEVLAARRSDEERRRAEALRAALRSAEDSRARAAKARATAESADAERYAGTAFRTAAQRDRQGRASLDGREYQKAESHFRDAERGFLAALDEANRARESERQQVVARMREQEAQTARLQAVAQARQAATDLRQQAQKAGADVLAKEVFDEGSTRFKDAETLAQSRKWAEAADGFRDAGGRFTAAERRVREIGDVRTHADAAKERREQALRAGADRLAKEVFDAAAARHNEADRVARGPKLLAAIPIYDEAAERYRTAERRATASGRAREEVLGVLADYSRAFENKDAELLGKVRPGLSPREVNAYRDSWAEVSSFRVLLNPERVDIRGDEAEVTGRRQDIVIRKDGRRERGEGERPFRFKLRRGKDGWAIDSVN